MRRTNKRKIKISRKIRKTRRGGFSNVSNAINKYKPHARKRNIDISWYKNELNPKKPGEFMIRTNLMKLYKQIDANGNILKDANGNDIIESFPYMPWNVFNKDVRGVDSFLKDIKDGLNKKDIKKFPAANQHIEVVDINNP